MDTNRKLLLKACVASMVLIATGVSAQTTIYKQVDEDGRVIFTDQPRPSARTVASFESSRPRAQPGTDSDSAPRGAADPARRVMAQAGAGEVTDPAPRYAVDPSPRYSVDNASGTAPDTPRRTIDAASWTNVDSSLPAGAARGRGDVERAVYSYATLMTPQAAQIDATEAARRARQDMNKGSAKPVFVVQGTPRDHDAAGKTGMSSMYVAWAVTFMLLAAGLLYVGWQVFRLILGRAFPRWELGLA